jgi:hypothetical protein
MRPTPLDLSFVAAFTLTAAAAASAAPLAEKLAGTWTCHAAEGKSSNDTLMTVTYRHRPIALIGEITETGGAVLVDVWLDDFGGTPLALRRLLSDDATVEMKVVEETATELKLEGELDHILGTTARVREVFRFSGEDAFRAIWEDDSGGCHVVLDRHCERT